MDSTIRNFSVAEGTISYQDSGENKTGSSNLPVFICIPGIGDLNSQYRMLTPLLFKSGYRVVSMDVRGMGNTKGNWKNYSAKEVGQDIVQLIHNLNIGNSRGVIVC